MSFYNALENTVIIIPALNEADSIGQLVTEIIESYPTVDVLVVDDGSTDKTRSSAIRAGAKVLTLVNNMGYGVALQTGYKYAYSRGYQYCLQMDGDGQHRVCDIAKLMTELLSDDCDIVIGSRFINGQAGYEIPLARKMGIAFFRAIVHFFTKNTVKDITSGFQAFNRKVLQRYTSDDLPYYYPDADVLILMIKGGFKVTEVSTPMNESRNGKSMHDSVFSQAYYVLTMALSIMVIILKGLKK